MSIETHAHRPRMDQGVVVGAAVGIPAVRVMHHVAPTTSRDAHFLERAGGGLETQHSASSSSCLYGREGPRGTPSHDNNIVHAVAALLMPVPTRAAMRCSCMTTVPCGGAAADVALPRS
jgi:hypothetical protein